jgi:hypothetical protein
MAANAFQNQSSEIGSFRLGLFSCLALLATVLLSCNPRPPDEPENLALQVRENPHADCKNCHSTKNPQLSDASFAFGMDPSQLCSYCHNYQENHHPVDFVPTVSYDENMPLFGGKIKCLTCHKMHDGSNYAGTDKLLRGGPFEDRRESCFLCHDEGAYAELNPHEMLDEQGQIRQVNNGPVCLVCHSKKPDPAVDRTNDVRFRADVAFLCWRCHPPMPGTFFDEHFLVTPREETLQLMLNTEAQHQVILPLVPRGRITCSTCHNPHQEGVMQHIGAAKGADAPSRLRIQPTCVACHP